MEKKGPLTRQRMSRPGLGVKFEPDRESTGTPREKCKESKQKPCENAETCEVNQGNEITSREKCLLSLSNRLPDRPRLPILAVAMDRKGRKKTLKLLGRLQKIGVISLVSSGRGRSRFRV